MPASPIAESPELLARQAHRQAAVDMAMKIDALSLNPQLVLTSDDPRCTARIVHRDAQKAAWLAAAGIALEEKLLSCAPPRDGNESVVCESRSQQHLANATLAGLREYANNPLKMPWPIVAASDATGPLRFDPMNRHTQQPAQAFR